MKLRLATAFVIFACLGVLTCGVHGAETNVLQFINPDLQLGALTNDQDVPVTFMLTNRSDQAVRIANVDTSCHCTSVLKSPEEIPAHGSGAVELNFNSSRSDGPVTQSVVVETAAGQILTAQFSAMVGPAAEMAVKTNASAPVAGGRFRQRGDFVHDPSTIIKCGNEYWFFSTGTGITSHHSPDLTNWQLGPRIFNGTPDWATNAVPANNGSFWAPDVIHLGDRYLLYYSISIGGKRTSVIGLATNPTLDPAAANYHWTDHGLVIGTSSKDDFNAIDPSIFHDNDGSLWLSFGSFWSGIKLIQLNPATGLPLGNSGVIYSIAQHIVGKDKSIEASCLTRHGDYYYLFADWGLCCRGTDSTYEIRVGRSKTVTGPYLDKFGTDMMHNGGDLFLATEGRFIGPGHAGILSDNGTNWFSFHYYDGDRDGQATLGLRELHWTVDGWPTLIQP
jgi:arabinan endo-1,5-alpha-L-arabinosidase